MRAQVRTRQDQETPVTMIPGKYYSYRYAFDRSADSIQAGAPGQDYLAVDADDRRIAFVLCDGVSQSFYGDLAARILGDALVSWLWAQGSELLEKPDGAQQEILAFLNELTETANHQVNDFALDETLAPMLLAVLEKKRLLGSETIFTAGFLDMDIGQILLCWMGDARLRIWDAAEEISAKHFLPEAFLTRERWSTRRGMIGDLHAVRLPVGQVTRILTYSDGLARLDQAITEQSPGTHTLERIIAETKRLPGSDDVSLLEIWLGNTAAHQNQFAEAPKGLSVEVEENSQYLTARWQPVEGARRYEVSVQARQSWRIYSTSELCWQSSLEVLPQHIEEIRVRCWRGSDAGEWSAPWSVAAKQNFPPEISDSVVEKLPLVEPTPSPGVEKNATPLRVLQPDRARFKKFLAISCILLALVIGSFFALRAFLLDGAISAAATQPIPTAPPALQVTLPALTVLPTRSVTGEPGWP